MAQQTLLQMTQDILSEMSSDEVNSISDTTESNQVATIIKNKYYDIAARGQMPEHERLFALTSSNDSHKPVLMFIPAGVSKLTWLKYYDTNPFDGSSFDDQGGFDHDLNTDLVTTTNWSTTSVTSNVIGLGSKTFTVTSTTLPVTVSQAVTAVSGPNTMIGTVVSYVGSTLIINVTSFTGSGTLSSWVISSGVGNGFPGYLYVTMVPIEQFLEMTNRLNPAEQGVASFTFTEDPGNNFTFYYRDDHQPRYCTILENYYVLFDAFDSSQENTLQSSKTMCFGQIVPTFQMLDTFVPDLDDQQFPLLMNEAKALAFYTIKQQPHAKAEQEIKRQWSSIQKSKSVSNKPSYFDQLPNFGRMPRTGGYGGLWPKHTQMN